MQKFEWGLMNAPRGRSPNTVAIAFGAKALVVFSGAHCLAQRFMCRLDRLRCTPPNANRARREFHHK